MVGVGELWGRCGTGWGKGGVNNDGFWILPMFLDVDVISATVGHGNLESN